MQLKLLNLTRNLSVRFKSSMASVVEAKKAAAYQAVDEHVQCGQIIGIGSGSTVIFAVKRLSERIEQENLNVKCIPTSFQAKQLIIQHNIPLTELGIYPQIDVTIDGADEVNDDLCCIKGGGGCLLQEKIVASCSKKLVIIADYTKDSKKLGDQWTKGIPIEVVPMVYVPIINKIEKRLGGSAVLREAIRKAGPVVTDEGNFILDWKDFNRETDWEKINKELVQIPGVVETGIFVNMASVAYFGMEDGSVKIKVSNNAVTCPFTYSTECHN